MPYLLDTRVISDFIKGEAVDKFAFVFSNQYLRLGSDGVLYQKSVEFMCDFCCH